MFAGMPVSHRSGSGGAFGPWEIVATNNGDGATIVLPGYLPGDFVYVAAFSQNSSTGSAPGYPAAPSMTGFTEFGTETGAWQTGIAQLTYFRGRVTDLGRLMRTGDATSTISIGGNLRRWCAVTLRNAIVDVDYVAGPISMTSDTINRNISPADKRLVIGFSAGNTSGSPSFSPNGQDVASGSGRYLRLYDNPVPDAVSINWPYPAQNHRNGKIIRQIDFT